MNEKRKAIIEEAMVLFATKGYHSTSIQEIADRAGISKGGVYSYFSSKNELLVEIYRYYYQNIKLKMNKYEQTEGLHPKKRLQFQMKVYMEELLRHKEFILMHINENVSHSKELEEFLISVKKDSFHWYEESLTAIYGNKVLSYLLDLSIILRGMIDSYSLILFDTEDVISLDELTAFMISRLDDLVEGLVRKREKPLLDGSMNLFNSPWFIEDSSWRKQLHSDLLQLEAIVLDADIDKSTRQDCLESIELLKEEVKKDKPKKVIFQGLLNNIEVLAEAKSISARILLTLAQVQN